MTCNTDRDWKPRVLIADDDARFLAALRIRLEKQGFEVLTAMDSYIALSQAREFKPDVAVLDINMPAGDGFSVQQRLERLRRDEGLKKIPVIYVTGERSERVKALAKELGAFSLIYKPFEADALYETILRAIAVPGAAGRG